MSEQEPAVLDLAPLSGLDFDLDQYLGLWAIDEARFLLLFDQVARTDLLLHAQSNRGSNQQAAAWSKRQTQDGTTIAVVEINGTLTKRGSSLSRAGATVYLRKAVRDAAADDETAAILLRIDSPGGTVAGTADLGREVAAADKRKPVVAFVEDMTASAAYWVASQARSVYANDRTAMIGSIGTYAGLYDYSGYAAAKGIRPVLIRSGQFKGVGFPGTEITQEQRDYWQQLVKKTQAEFTAAIAAGRKLSTTAVEELADGRIHVAADALALGLIDGIQTIDETFGQLVGLAGNRKPSTSTRSKAIMAENDNQAKTADTPQPASFEELTAALPRATNDFLVDAQRKRLSIDQARSAWADHLQGQLEAKDQQLAEAKQRAAAAAEKQQQKASGVEPLGGAGGSTAGDAGDPVEAWEAAVREKLARPGMTQAKAISQLVREQPDLQKAYLEAYAAERGLKAR